MRNLSIFVGSGIQKKITIKILPYLLNKLPVDKISIVSLEKIYRLGIGNFYYPSIINIADHHFLPPWYERSRYLKIISLIPYTFQILNLGLKSKNNLFFVDTGMLERSAIFILRLMKRQTTVLQDAMKRKPIHNQRGILNWFGNGKADNYLLMGSRYLEMVQNRPACVVGSPIYENKISIPESRGKKILFINQCFSRYRELTEKQEIGFVKDIIAAATPYGQIEIRLHPYNKYDLYEIFANENVEISCEKPLNDSLSEAGIVLAINSTVILEALSCGLPILILDWHPTKFELPIQESVTHCSTIETMINILKKWKEMGDSFYCPDEIAIQEELQSHIAFSNHEAIDRITDALASIINVNSK